MQTKAKETKARLNLIVLYSQDMRQLCDELSAFGLEFVSHQHGSGPMHYACEKEGLCLEIYPASETNPRTHIRLGLSVESMDEAINSAQSIHAIVETQPKESPWVPERSSN
jgi:hypothetical protein